MILDVAASLIFESLIKSALRPYRRITASDKMAMRFFNPGF